MFPTPSFVKFLHVTLYWELVHFFLEIRCLLLEQYLKITYAVQDTRSLQLSFFIIGNKNDL